MTAAVTATSLTNCAPHDDLRPDAHHEGHEGDHQQRPGHFDVPVSGLHAWSRLEHDVTTRRGRRDGEGLAKWAPTMVITDGVVVHCTL